MRGKAGDGRREGEREKGSNVLTLLSISANLMAVQYHHPSTIGKASEFQAV